MADIYRGRFDLQNEGPWSLLEHILSFCEFVSGEAKAPWCGPEKYAEIVKQYRADGFADEFGQWLRIFEQFKRPAGISA